MKSSLLKLFGVGAGVVGLAGGGVFVGTRLSKPATELAAPKKQALKAELTQLERDQKERARQVSKIAQSPQVKKHPEVLKAAKELGAKQVEVALLLERTERMMAKDDPKARAYQQALGRSLTEADRAAHALNQVAYKKGIAPKPQTQWVPGKTARPMSPNEAAALGALVSIGATILALDLAYDWSRYAYTAFDRSWDVAYYAVPATAWVQCDVYAEIDALPRAEVAFVFNTYFTAYDRDFYADAMHIDRFAEAELTHWASAEYYDDAYASPELHPDWAETEEVARLEQDYGVETELDSASAYEHDWQVTEDQAEHFTGPEDLYPNDGHEPGEKDDVAAREDDREAEPADEPQPEEEPQQ